jgi:hypothetical protein
MTSDDPNRRRSERVAINSEFAGATTFVSDLSERGVFLHTEEKVAIGTKLELRFTVLLDDPVTVEALGTVMRQQQDPPGVGVQFGPLSPTMVLRINDAITRMRPLDLGPPLERPSEEDVTTVPAPPMQPPPVPARATAEVLTEDEFLDAKTGAFSALKLDDDHEVQVAGGRAPKPVAPEQFEAETTLFKLKPVDLEIVDDEEPDLD